MKTDIVIVGAGMVGALCALLAAEANFTVAVVHADLPQPLSADEYQPRVSALNPASIALLKKTGVWSLISAKQASPFERLTVWDGVGGSELIFSAAMMGLTELGYMVTNAAVIAAAWACLEAHPLIQCYLNQPLRLERRDAERQLVLTNGECLTTNLLVGADGANSWVRRFLGSPFAERSYDQSAIIAVIRSEKIHQQSAYQVFLPTGPLALLPLSDPYHHALVWSLDNSALETRLNSHPEEFTQQLNRAFGARLGALTVLSERQAYPLIMRHATQYVGDGIALIGDAAHTLHPMAGQGANLGFMDADRLIQVISKAREKSPQKSPQKSSDWASQRVLRDYERVRKAKNTEMLLAMRSLQRIFSLDDRLSVGLRSWGMRQINQSGFLKRFFMQEVLK
jgi:2-octaprenylphenol hydroxylase